VSITKKEAYASFFVFLELSGVQTKMFTTQFSYWCVVFTVAKHQKHYLLHGTSCIIDAQFSPSASIYIRMRMKKVEKIARWCIMNI